jgi:hypothetical protein
MEKGEGFARETCSNHSKVSRKQPPLSGCCNRTQGSARLGATTALDCHVRQVSSGRSRGFTRRRLGSAEQAQAMRGGVHAWGRISVAERHHGGGSMPGAPHVAGAQAAGRCRLKLKRVESRSSSSAKSPRHAGGGASVALKAQDACSMSS